MSGGAKGADSLAEKYALENNIETEIFYPDWDKDGKAAGFIRNNQIIKNSNIVFAFTNGSNGTQNSINIAKKLNIITNIIPIKENLKNLKIEVEEHLNISKLKKNKSKIYVYGDNLIKKGKKGQAQIRDEENSFGIPTKRLPSMKEDSFFSDLPEERESVISSLKELYKLALKGKTIVFPQDGLGTGLAKMQTHSPMLFEEMNQIIFSHFFMIGESKNKNLNKNKNQKIKI